MARKPDYFIHDEAHHCKSVTWETIAKLPGFHVAFSATPLRLDGKSLKDLFPGFVDSGYDVSWFIDQGYLNNFEVKSTFTVEFEKQKGIDNLKYQSEKLDKRELLGDAVEEWKKHAYGRKTITFCTTIEHCYHTLEAYKNAGIPATVIDSKMTFDQRKEALEGFASGRYMVIINVAILTEGVDVPDAECCQLLRFTNSIPLYFQMVGRVLRPSKNRSIILDHAGNVEHHMTPDCPIDWRELYYAQVDMKDVASFNPYVLCQCCEHELMKKSEKPDFTITKICPKCGFENIIEPPKKRDPVSTKQGELFDFKMSRQEQMMYKIYSSDIPHQNKVAQILKCLKHPNFTEGDVKSGLNILYYDHPDREMIVNRYMELGRKKVLEAKVKKRLR